MMTSDLVQYLAECHAESLQKEATEREAATGDILERLDTTISGAPPAEEEEKVAVEDPRFAQEDFLMAAVLTYADANRARGGGHAD